MSGRVRDATALFGFALSVGAAPAAPEDGPTFSSGHGFDQRSGESLYRSICQGCHMPDGQGARGAGAYPALAGNEKLANAAYPVVVVLNGVRNMPSFAGSLDDAQVAAVVNYVRSHLGNVHDDEVAIDQVAALRPRPR